MFKLNQFICEFFFRAIVGSHNDVIGEPSEFRFVSNFTHMTFRMCKFIDTASWKWRIIQGTRICGCIRFPLMTCFSSTLPETNIAHENPIFPGKYHQNGGFSMAMLVYRSVIFVCFFPLFVLFAMFWAFSISLLQV